MGSFLYVKCEFFLFCVILFGQFKNQHFYISFHSIWIGKLFLFYRKKISQNEIDIMMSSLLTRNKLPVKFRSKKRDLFHQT